MIDLLYFFAGVCIVIIPTYLVKRATMNADKNIWLMYEREGRGYYVSFTKPTRQQKVSHAPVHYRLVEDDTVAQKVEPPAKESGGGFESHPVSPNPLWKQLAFDVGISIEYLTNTKQINMIEAYAEKIVKECNDLVSYECEAAMKKHLGLNEIQI